MTYAAGTALLGTALMLLSVVITMNTSAGGSRPDYNDGSDRIGKIGLFLFVVGSVGAIVVGLKEVLS